MNIDSRGSAKRRLAVASRCVGIFILAGILVSYFFPRAFPSVCVLVPMSIAKAIPRTAWTYGPPSMQRFAAKQLAGKIIPGMSFDHVYAVLGKGALSGEQLKGKVPREGETVSFNVRSWYNNGLDVRFTNGVVSTVSYYD